MAVTTRGRQVPPCLGAFPVLIASPLSRWETEALPGRDRVRTDPLIPNPTRGPGVVQTLRCEDQVCHSHTLHRVPCHQEAGVSLGLAT